METFTVKKLVGVLASLAGIFLISRVDLSGSMDDNRGSFPHKTTKELALGDAMAIFSAILYGAYAVLMKKRIGNEERINMPLFFGLVGLFNVVFLWPGFIILHFLGSEPFELPPTGRIWAVVLVSPHLFASSHQLRVTFRNAPPANRIHQNRLIPLPPSSQTTAGSTLCFLPRRSWSPLGLD